MELVTTFASLAACGVLVGVFSGLLGVGGGIMMVPLYRLVFGLSAHAAAATSLFTMVFTSLSGAATHVRNGTCVPKLGVALGIGGCATSVLGVRLGNMSPAWAIMLVACAIICYTSYTMVRKAFRKPADASAGDAGVSGDGSVFVVDARTFAAGIVIGMVAGLVAGYVGVGGGFIMVPLMTSFLGVPMKKASGTSLVAIVILSVPAILGQGFAGNVQYLYGLAMAAGSLPGAVLGARLVKRMPERQLRLAFAAFLVAAGVMLVLNETGVL